MEGRDMTNDADLGARKTGGNFAPPA